jgi:hypothetical protein
MITDARLKTWKVHCDGKYADTVARCSKEKRAKRKPTVQMSAENEDTKKDVEIGIN